MLSHALSMFIALNVAPTAAKYIGLYDNDGYKIGVVEIDDFKSQDEEPLYTFGLLSDVHITINSSASASLQSREDLINAITYFTNKENVEFTVVSGDLGYQYNYAEEELTKYTNAIAQVTGHAPIYPTTGNHDCPSSGNVNIERFRQKTGIPAEWFTDGAVNSYEMTVTNEVNPYIEDHFLFLGINTSAFPTDATANRPYLDSDIEWLQRRLEEYKNDRCFVITHLFFKNAAGNVNRVYTRRQNNWLRGRQLNSLLYLRDKYPRSIWFSGHSHWKYQLQYTETNATIDPTNNVGRAEGWAVHVSSCANPCVIENDSKKSKDKESQGCVVDVYDDHINLRSIEFKGTGNTTYVNKFIPIGQYRVPTEPDGKVMTNKVSVTYDMLHEHTGKNYPEIYVNDLTHDVTVTFTKNSQGVLIYKDLFRENQHVEVYHDGIVWDPEISPVGIEAIDYIGFYCQGKSMIPTLRYTLISGVSVDTSERAIQLQTSSNYSTYGTFPVKFTIKNLRYAIIGN